tara:strand:- start:1016 stop:1630 length:615 start_codon:yes stop_codon:yes gene_type:complete
MYKYPIIIFEGIEASGKSTNIRIIANYLKKIKRKFIQIREPGGTKQSEKIRNLILNNKTNFNFKSDFFLIMASRSENVEKIINKNFNKKIILIDRFTDSTIAYQHYGMGYNLNLIKNLNKFILGKYKPNLTFLSIVNKKNLKKRLQKRVFKNKYDKFNFRFYDKVQNGYLKLAKNKNNYIILNSNIRNIKENSSFIINKISKVI